MLRPQRVVLGRAADAPLEDSSLPIAPTTSFLRLVAHLRGFRAFLLRFWDNWKALAAL
jgi:hypothetical protein